jgi:hypothetical protein
MSQANQNNSWKFADLVLSYGVCGRASSFVLSVWGKWCTMFHAALAANSRPRRFSLLSAFALYSVMSHGSADLGWVPTFCEMSVLETLPPRGVCVCQSKRVASRQAEDGVPCEVHRAASGPSSPASCSLPEEGWADCGLICTPCQPFSALRDCNGVPVSEHKDYKTTFGQTGSLVSFVGRTKPKVLVVEQVTGLEKQSKDKGCRTYKQLLLDGILAIPSSTQDGFYYTAGTCLNTDMSTFIDGSRPRSSSSENL